MAEREQWGSRIGLILAMAGNAVGLGNFLRFPVQAAQNGGGAFLIPYFAALILISIPLMWIEWAIGRNGGKYNHGSLPGMFDVLWKNPLAKYLGVIGLFGSTIILIYYTYLVSWTLGFSFFSLFKTYFGLITFEGMSSFLGSFQGTRTGYFSNPWTCYAFLIITFVINFWIMKRGLSKGIELLAKIALPALFVFALILVIRVATIGTPDPVNNPDWSVAKGFAFLWNPNFSMLGDAKIWLAAAGQVFFTLSVGMGTLHAYASYVKPKDDIVLSGLATAGLNELAEVVLGAVIAIPVAVAFFGLDVTKEIAAGGSFNLAFVSMPIIFQKIPFGEIFGFFWFFLLFFAGITSTVAMAQPLISFLKERFKLSHNKATAYIGIFAFICLHFVFFFFQYGVLDEMDYWAGTFVLVVIALVEVVIFGWMFGMEKGWKEINMGADIKIPTIFKYIIKYVTPFFLLVILISWTVQDAIPILLMDNISPENIPYRWGARALMIFIFVALCFMVFLAWKKNDAKS